ncbi:hypothetical protein H0H87_012426 [Tephrocybe sp. NHM501043]|nr:hypothetical protein H0H87_012426 [Tephrocybe sp. NHM501043]
MYTMILDLRERGSETVSHSEGTGITAFTTKSMSQQQCSPFTPPHRKNGAYGRRIRGGNTISSNIMLSTLGSIHHDVDLDLDLEQDLSEIEDIHRGIGSGVGLDLGSLSTAVGGDDGEPIAEGASQIGTPAPSYEPFELGFRDPPPRSSMESGLHGIRVDVERTTSTI